ncbi:amidase family protein [Staphylococcus agnetis]|uniref:amidase family protein n=1 Tax=Staphylococcus agnetis TaxID=985762 RepID=UPI00208EEC1B|nr:amidase family protein [Staphylococcus agnetis]MCO4346538.1 amidase family protein [Staphylococcus agnetis]
MAIFLLQNKLFNRTFNKIFFEDIYAINLSERKNNVKRIITFVALVVIAIIIILIAVYIWIFKQAPLEYAQYNTEKINNDINKQLKRIDLKRVRSKEHLILEKNIQELHKSVEKGELTYTDITAFYLDRIQNIDQQEKGLNAILEINPNAIKLAKEYDKRSKEEFKPLYGLPVTLKDNINTIDMPTSAGTHILRNFYPSKDAKVTTQLKNNGAIILAKTNLSELANFMSFKMPDGYSSKGGQTQNPYGKLKFSPLGSSSGSAVSITSNIGVASVGTETTGSIISPSYAQSVVGFKPSHEKVSNQGVFPLSPSLDTIGPITRNVMDAIVMYNVMNTDSDNKIKVNELSSNVLQSVKVGISKKIDDDSAEKIRTLLHKLGARTYDVEINQEKLNNTEIINNEFKFAVNCFSEENKLPFKTLSHLIDYNQNDKNKRMKYGQYLIEMANENKNDDNKFVESQIKLAQNRLKNYQRTDNLDFIISYNDDEILLPAIAGAPVITIPYNRDDNEEPKSLTLIGFKNEDNNLLKAAYALEQSLSKRELPDL